MAIKKQLIIASIEQKNVGLLKLTENINKKTIEYCFTVCTASDSCTDLLLSFIEKFSIKGEITEEMLHRICVNIIKTYCEEFYMEDVFNSIRYGDTNPSKTTTNIIGWLIGEQKKIWIGKEKSEPIQEVVNSN